jgi:hypothetical protein
MQLAVDFTDAERLGAAHVAAAERLGAAVERAAERLGEAMVTSAATAHVAAAERIGAAIERIGAAHEKTDGRTGRIRPTFRINMWGLSFLWMNALFGLALINKH